MAFTRLNQTFAFHSSPESFISSRIQQLSLSNPEALPSTSGTTKIACASILNRNVHIVSSYDQCKAILECSDTTPPTTIVSDDPKQDVGSGTFAVGPAYRELMSEFFPSPNILLEDGLSHHKHKERWTKQLSTLLENTESSIRRLTRSFVGENFVLDMTVDLYETLKTLSWILILVAFLDLEPGRDCVDFHEIETAQEVLLRGQFSLFPVAISTPFWQSPRSKGLKARRDLQNILKQHVEGRKSQQCPVLKEDVVDRPDIASHLLLFTSSIANKALASLMTASIINLFLMPGQKSLAELLRSHNGKERQKLIRSIVLETARLSPPVIGVMRRVQHDIQVQTKGPNESMSHGIPKGDDAWLYFVAANRDESAFEDAKSFRFDRFMHEDTNPSISFGAGMKTCLGAPIVLQMVSIVIEEMLGTGIDLQGEVSADGIKAWLGWVAVDDPQAFAKDLKQLPCQRPREPVMVKVRLSE